MERGDVHFLSEGWDLHDFHVRHRLEQYRAGAHMDFDEATPENLAKRMESLLAQPADYAAVETGTAARAAQMIAGLLQ